MNKKRFIVRDVVCDYGVFDTEYAGGESLDCICNARANAELIADILNVDYSKPNECTYYENELQQENTILKKALELSIKTQLFDFDYDTREEFDKAVRERYNFVIEQAKESIDEDRNKI